MGLRKRTKSERTDDAIRRALNNLQEIQESLITFKTIRSTTGRGSRSLDLSVKEFERIQNETALLSDLSRDILWQLLDPERTG